MKRNSVKTKQAPLEKTRKHNKLFYGDNLEVLRKYIDSESIDLCYIDPPFNSKRNYNQIYLNQGKEDKAQSQAFVDTWTWDDDAIKGFEEIINNYKNSFSKQTIQLIIGLEKVLGKTDLMAYLIHITLRATEIQRVLKPTGSFYLHCDPTASHYIKLVLDAIFCSHGGDYLNEITWKRNFTKKGSQFKMHRFANNGDKIFFYCKSNNYFFETPKVKFADGKELEKLYDKIDENGKRFKSEPIELPAMMARDNLKYSYRGYTPINGWMMKEEKLRELDNNGKLYFTSSGKPRRKNFIEDYTGTEIDNIWVDILPLGQKQSEGMGYPTQKPEALLERIINASSNKGDVILDAYCGCGTTVAVAERLGRKWIGIDVTYQSISLILKRLRDSYGEKVLDKVELNGVPQDIESAIALANKKEDKTRKEFEKWTVLTYSDNRAIINEKKGADGGIDGIAFINDFEKNGVDVGIKQILFSVKSDKKPHVSYIRDLNGAMQREDAVMGYFITLYPPTKDMLEESKKLGKYKNNFFGKDYDRVKIITVEQILKGDLFDVPKTHEVAVVKSAKKKENKKDQTKLF